MALSAMLRFPLLRSCFEKYGARKLDEHHVVSDLVVPVVPEHREFKDHFDQILQNPRHVAMGSLSVSLAYYQFLKILGVKFDAYFGYSFGDVSALAAAGYLSDDDAFNLLEVLENAELAKLRELTIQCSYPSILPIIKLHKHISVSQFNHLNETVVVGEQIAIDKLKSDCDLYNIKYTDNATTHHLHRQHIPKLQEKLNSMSFSPNHNIVISGLTAKPYPNHADQIKKQFFDQFEKPFLWMQSIQQLETSGFTTLIDCGPGDILSNQIRSGFKTKMQVITCDQEKNDFALDLALGKLFCSGFTLDFKKLWDNIITDFPHRYDIAQPGSVLINGTTYNKPYPANKETEMTERKQNGPDSTLAEQLLKAQLAYQENLLASHKAFLEALTSVTQQSNEDAAQTSAPVAEKIVMPKVEKPKEAAPIVVQAPSPKAPDPIVLPTITQPPAAQKTTSGSKNEGILLDLVSEKTGYDKSLINLDMDLENDLGIDSLLKVDLVSSLATKFPNATDVSPEEFIQIKTLKDVLVILNRVTQ
jgi:acyl transferase domain-containing protein/acyl carrier protein